MPIAFTPTPVSSGSKVHKLHDLLCLIGELTFSGSYATGGEVITAPNFETLLKQIGNGTVHQVIFDNNSVGYLLDYDYTTKKVLVFQGDNTNAAAAPGIQLPAAGYPAALTGLAAGNRVKVTVIGF